MKYVIRQRIVSLLDSFDIYDENGNAVYTVKGKLSIGHNLHFITPFGEDIASVKEVVIRFFPKFEFYVYGNYEGMLRRRFSPMHPQYDLDFNGWHVSGDFMNWNWNIYDENNQIVASIRRELLHLSDHYVINVSRKEDALCALMITVAIDAERCTASKAS